MKQRQREMWEDIVRLELERTVIVEQLNGGNKLRAPYAIG